MANPMTTITATSRLLNFKRLSIPSFSLKSPQHKLLAYTILPVAHRKIASREAFASEGMIVPFQKAVFCVWLKVWRAYDLKADCMLRVFRYLF
jgi:hypothetical protein